MQFTWDYFTIFLFSGGGGRTDPLGDGYSTLDDGSQGDESNGVGESVLGVIFCLGLFLGLLVILLLCLNNKGGTKKYKF